MAQLEAFPRKIVEFRPLKRTAHAIGRARAEDDKCYIVKANTTLETNICATELINNSIADSLNLPVTKTEILQMADGQLVVGSLEIEPRLSDIEVSLFLTGKARNDLFVSGIQETLSSTYALDLALGNDDRHECNFIIAVSGTDDAAQKYGTMSVIDFSSSDILASDKRPIPFPRASNTRRAGRLIRKAHGFSIASANDTLARLSKGKDFILERALMGIPEEWLPKSERDGVREWMLGLTFANRLERIDSGLRDGSFL